MVIFGGTLHAVNAELITWAGSSTGFWEDQSSWSPPQLPSRYDDVVISNASVTVRDSDALGCFANSLIIQHGQLSVESLVSFNILNISIYDASGLAIGQPLIIEHLYVFGGSLSPLSTAFPQSIAINGSLTVNSVSNIVTFDVDITLMKNSHANMIGQQINFNTLTIQALANASTDSRPDNYTTTLRFNNLVNNGQFAFVANTSVTIMQSIQIIPGNDQQNESLYAFADVDLTLKCAGRH